MSSRGQRVEWAPGQDPSRPRPSDKGPEGRCEGPRPPPGAASGRRGLGWAQDPLEHPGNEETQWRPRPPFWIVPPLSSQLPYRDRLSERDEDNGTERPPTSRRPQRRPGPGYQGPARRDEPREEQMAADGSQGRAYLSTASVYGGSNRDGGGKRPSLPVPGSPGASRLPGRRGACAGCRKRASRCARSAAGLAAGCFPEMELRTPPPVAVAGARLEARFGPPAAGRLCFYFVCHARLRPGHLCGHGGLREPNKKRFSRGP